jgi:putative transposase
VKLTYRYRVKNKNGLLNRQARAVNFVWNFCNDRQRDAHKWGRRWLSGYDLGKLCAGSNKELGLLANTVDKACHRYADSRVQHKRPYLRYRGKKSLGWVPLRGRDIHPVADGVRIGAAVFRLFYSRQIPEGAKICDGGSFAQDSLGNWFLNLVLDLPEAPQREMRRAVGIDLGLKDFAALSTGERIANPRHYANEEAALAKAQRAGKKRLARNIHARIENRRRDALHKLSTRLTREFDLIAVGGVEPARLAKTSMAKSVNDAGWYTFRTMLAYKAIGHGARYEEVDEAFSTQFCSECGLLGGPKGIAELGIRLWKCACGASHDRDVNAARNILARSGHRAPVEGIAA